MDAKPIAGGDEELNVAGLNASEESSFKVKPLLEGNNTSCLLKDELNGHQKLSHTKVFPPSVSHAADISPSDGDLNENSTDDARNNSFYAENAARFNVNGDADAASWRQTRSARSAETWSGFRPEGGEDASFSDQEEFQLTSSTFALTGDTAHNQAMVHWSGQNSSVSI